MNQPKGTAGKDHFGKDVRLAATWDEACKAINAIHSYGSTVLHAFVCTLPKHDENTLHASFDLDGNQIAGWWDHDSSPALTAKAGFVSVGARPVGEPATTPTCPKCGHAPHPGAFCGDPRGRAVEPPYNAGCPCYDNGQGQDNCGTSAT